MIQLENDPEKDIYNGEIGIVKSVARVRGRVETRVLFDNDHEIVYEPDDLNQLTLAYAISIHKAQGSEFKTVIVTMNGRFDTMLRRNLLYTAVTRAREHLYLVGDLATFIRAAGLPSIIRTTGLVQRLDQKFEEDQDIPSISKEMQKVIPVKSELIEKKEPQINNQPKTYTLTPENYQNIDPMIGMSDISPTDF
ncbi:hypothetical protein KIMC2_07180 [Xylocopilactobacillus apis]|uniref:UvrD-like helicase C-terminal domain-containing protein n=1 Tax=Xylocopilactobacillus apis TaxID=2932183 RepID=A0AAU9D100_9LACO|nr:hypothetical protein KIMC2_07180 [Xylocopilactobacillus apis]